MKRLSIVGTIALLFSLQAPFAQKPKQVVSRSFSSMRGTYVLQKQTIDSGMGTQPINIQQWKIFTDKYVMYAHRASASDSSAIFGVGTYRVENGNVFENMFYGQEGPVNGQYQLKIEHQNDGYTQVIDFPGTDKHYLLTEVYQRNSRNQASPLDGAWHLEKRVYIDKDGKTTTAQNSDSAKQFKIYDSGHFMWASSWNDGTTGKRASSYGYGTFVTDAGNVITETNASSTYASVLEGKPVKVEVKFKGTDAYEQLIKGEDGSKQIEYYTRLK